jgi:hypothetical protein
MSGSRLASADGLPRELQLIRKQFRADGTPHVEFLQGMQHIRKYPGGGYMALELFFVSARTNKRHHHRCTLHMHPPTPGSIVEIFNGRGPLKTIQKVCQVWLFARLMQGKRGHMEGAQC